MKFSFTSTLARVSTAAGLAMAGAHNALANTPLNIPDTIPVNDTGPGEEGLINAIIEIINIVLNFLGIIAVVVVIIAGIRLIIGGQDEGQREKARNMIVYAIIGLLIVIFAKVIIDFVVSAFTTDV